MRAVLFVFYMIETVLNLFCVAFHISGFMTIPLNYLTSVNRAMLYLYLAIFYFFSVITLFASIRICTGYRPSVVREMLLSSSAALSFIAVSILTMRDAEKGFHLLHLVDEEGLSHPFIEYLRSVSIAALSSGVVYFLHAVLMIDVHLTGGESAKGLDAASVDQEYFPIHLYIFGAYIEKKLSRFAWFHEFNYNFRTSL